MNEYLQDVNIALNQKVWCTHSVWCQMVFGKLSGSLGKEKGDPYFIS